MVGQVKLTEKELFVLSQSGPVPPIDPTTLIKLSNWLLTIKMPQINTNGFDLLIKK